MSICVFIAVFYLVVSSNLCVIFIIIIIRQPLAFETHGATHSSALDFLNAVGGRSAAVVSTPLITITHCKWSWSMLSWFLHNYKACLYYMAIKFNILKCNGVSMWQSESLCSCYALCSRWMAVLTHKIWMRIWRCFQCWLVIIMTWMNLLTNMRQHSLITLNKLHPWYCSHHILNPLFPLWSFALVFCHGLITLCLVFNICSFECMCDSNVHFFGVNLSVI